MPLPQLFDKKPSKNHNQQTGNAQHGNKPGDKKTTKKKRFRVWKKLGIAVIILIILGFAGAAGVFAWYSKDLPDSNKISERDVAESTRIYDRTGTILLYEVHGEQRRTRVDLENIPQFMRDATIVTEDREFYSHSGIALKSIARAIIKNILKGDLTGEGGSTITQQFVKNAILTSDKKIDRKIKEAILSYQIEKKFSKDEILELYLNEIPYGSNAYGIEAASNFYFGRSAKDLTIGQAAVLAALPQRPSYYSPYGAHTDALLGRQQYILEEMNKEGYITNEELETAQAEKIEFKQRIENIKAPHFVFYIRELLEDKYRTSTVEQGGLKVITTLDVDKQVMAEEAVRLNMDKVEQYGGSNAALVALDTKTGQVLAMVGSRDYWDTENDGNVNAALSPLQPGSSMKPLVYASAFQKGYTPQTMLFDLETDFPIESGTYHPRNYDLGQRGPIEMQKALAGSLNIPAVMTLYLTGVDTVIDNAQKLGYTTLNDRSRYGLALVLGGAEVKLLEHTSAFATFAREGEYHKPNPILRIEDHDGNVLEEFQDKPERVFEEQPLRQLNKILSTDSLRAFIFGSRTKLTLPDRPIAAKTGTTNDYRDGWTMGFTPSLAAGVWVGNNDHSEMKRGADGSIVAAPIWNQFMSQALAGTPVEEFKNPDPIKVDKPILRGQIDELEKKKVDKITGKVIPDQCMDTYPKEYIVEKEFKKTHSILHYVNKDDPRGKAPTKPQEDPYYNTWEAVVKKWAEGQPDYVTKDYEYENCDLRSETKNPQVTIQSPTDGASVNSNDFTIQTTIKAGEGRTIKQVEYSIDNNVIDTKTQSPYQTTYKPSNLTSGKHTLAVKATDSLDSTTTKSVTFTYSEEGISADDVYFANPTKAVTYKSTNFPVSLILHVGKPNQVTQVKFHYYNASGVDDEHHIISTVTSGISETVTALWASAPSAGTYNLYAKVTTKDGQVIRTDDIPITVTSSHAGGQNVRELIRDTVRGE